MVKIWVDDVRPAPYGYIWCKSVNEAISKIIKQEELLQHSWYQLINDNQQLVDYYLEEIDEAEIKLIDIDHDAGDYASDGGDYIKLLDWLEETNRNYPIHIHSKNPVGVENMRRIIRRNGWREV